MTCLTCPRSPPSPAAAPPSTSRPARSPRVVIRSRLTYTAGYRRLIVLQLAHGGASAALAVVIMSTITVNESTTLAPVTDQLLGHQPGELVRQCGERESDQRRVWKSGNQGDSLAGRVVVGYLGTRRTSTTNLLPYNCKDPGPGSRWGGYSSFADFMMNIVKAGQFDLALTANYGSNATCNAEAATPPRRQAWVAEAVSQGYPPQPCHGWKRKLRQLGIRPPIRTSTNATTYANAVIGAGGYSALIKAASPTSKVGVVVNANCTTASGCTNGWDSTVLSLAKGSYDFVEYHYYPHLYWYSEQRHLPASAGRAGFHEKQSTQSKPNSPQPDTPPAFPFTSAKWAGTAANPGTQSWSITQELFAGQLLGEAMNAGISRLTWWDGIGNCFRPPATTAPRSMVGRIGALRASFLTDPRKLNAPAPGLSAPCRPRRAPFSCSATSRWTAKARSAPRSLAI